MMTQRMFRWILIPALSLLSTLALADPLQISLSKGTLEGTVNLELTNTGEQTLSVLKWDTPFEARLSHDVFQVSTSAKALPFVDAASYIGRHAKRATPTAENYLTLRPGESRTASIKLTDYYDIQQQSLYSVRFVGQIRHVATSKKQSKYANKKYLAQSNKAGVMDYQSLISNQVSVALTPQTSNRIQPPAYNSCSVNQQSYIQSATQSAELLTNTAVADLQSLALSERETSPRYTTWFGTYTATRYNQVLENFQAIGSALANQTIRYDCTCNETGVFAYVYPVRPYDVFLCPSFHAANETGTDSRAGTIIHELSHFNILADTEDHIYSQQGAQSLANNDPARAIENADSHEYFAENTPNLPIRSDSTTPPATQFTQLTLNNAVTGTVAEGTADYYQISNAESIALRSDTGDADLYVYSDPQLNQLSCQSSNIEPDDQCEVFNEGTLYIMVYGYVDSTYTLQVTGQSSEPPESIATLMVDSTVSGTIAQGARSVYQVTGADLINLESLTGDADLFVFSSTDYNDANLVCSSILEPPENPTDSCTLPDSDSTYYVMLVGWLDSTYLLTATATQAGTSPEFVITAFGNLLANQQVSRSVEAQAVHTYTASGISLFELTSLTGDADLLIFDGPILGGGQLICSSEEFSSDAILDRCDVSSSSISTFEVAVFGYEASDYTLVGLSNSTGAVTPPNDPGQNNPDPVQPSDPTTPSNLVAGNSSGGGTMGSLWLVIGLSVVGFRKRRRPARAQS